MSHTQDMTIFGVRIDNNSQEEIVARVCAFLSSDTYNHIATLNPEILLKARKDNKYKKILNATQLNISDGIGIKFALWYKGRHLKCRFTGVDLMYEVLDHLNARGGSVFLAVHKDGLSNCKEVGDAITKLYPKIEVSGKDIDSDHILDNIENVCSDVVLCNFGAPEQERYLREIREVTCAKIGMGIGGSFEYLTNKIPRAPRFVRTVGLEWLYRLYQQPRRWKRICKAVIIFPVFILLNKK